MNFYEGQKVLVILNNDKKLSREIKGTVYEIHDKFLCIWLEARRSPGVGWKECFLFFDIGKTVLIKPRTVEQAIEEKRKIKQASSWK